MEWNKLISTKRLGQEHQSNGDHLNDRSEFQRDYDRIIFSSPFRRMQNKTQVFPLPGRIFVHNRLTHSLEVASVGRSLGNSLSEKLALEISNHQNPLLNELGTIISTACLAHDLGNPPFGHSGEAAISNYFTKGSGREFEKTMEKGEWKDFTMFDGNANAFRILTHQFGGKRPGGFALTYTTLASIVKYPVESFNANKQKFGFSQSERDIYQQVAEELGIPENDQNPGIFARHPLVFLVEAADDICYQIMDIEDAFKLGILSYDETRNLYLGFYDKTEDKQTLDSIEDTLKRVTDPNEQITYLRAGVIGKLVGECTRIFWKNRALILNGKLPSGLIKLLDPIQAKAMDEVIKISFSRVYNHRSVVEIEIAGYKIIGTLLSEFIGAMMLPGELYSKKLISLVPSQFIQESVSTYSKIQSVVDFVSGMTDVYALDLYRKIKGISLPEIG
jgi:dGTPase